MESSVLQPALTLLDLSRISNEKLLAAAIDLAVFTAAGINADQIGAWAMAGEKLVRNAHLPSPELFSLAEDLRKGIVRLCQVGQSIWATSNRKFLYELPEAFLIPFAAQTLTPAAALLKKAA